MSNLSTPNLSGTIVCKCGAWRTVTKSGVVQRHDGCGFSGLRLKPQSIELRRVPEEAVRADQRRRLRAATPGKVPAGRWGARALGIMP